MSDVRTLETKVRRLERKIDELIRQLKRSNDKDVQHAARRADSSG